MELVDVTASDDLAEVRSLFVEYGASLNFSLCFQSFDEELRTLPGAYTPPKGRLILARLEGAAAGCIALKPLDSRTCEMKRLYVRPLYRGRRLGLALVRRLIADARTIGYDAMRLDTIVGPMDQAIALYRVLGFREIEPYYANPIENALYFELTL